MRPPLSSPCQKSLIEEPVRQAAEVEQAFSLSPVGRAAEVGQAFSLSPVAGRRITRRAALAAATGTWLKATRAAAAEAPAAPVAVARCPDYGSSLLPALERMFDQLGGLGRLVKGKTVTVKINMTGGPRERMGNTPSELAQFTHPAVTLAVVHLLGRAGAVRVRVAEGCYNLAGAEPLGEFMHETGWDTLDLLNAAPKVELANTNFAGAWKKYATFPVPGGGRIFKAYVLSKAYEECDVLVSISKLKEHATAGVTLGMKNMFGCTPISIYGEAAGKDEPNEQPTGGRGSIMHRGLWQPSAIAPRENDPSSSRDDKYRIPRIVADLAAALPLHLSVIDGIYTMAGGEGPWIRHVRPVHPGVLAAGFNSVCTDAVGTALMGFDPMAVRGQAPFEHCDSTLQLAEELGAGTRDLRRIEVRGVPIRDAVFSFRKA